MPASVGAETQLLVGGVMIGDRLLDPQAMWAVGKGD